MPIICGAARDPDQHPVWNYLYQERQLLLIHLLPTLAMKHLAHNLPYQRSTIKRKLKEPTVILTKQSKDKSEMNLREYLDSTYYNPFTRFY